MIVHSFKNELFSVLYSHRNASIPSAVSSAMCLYHSGLSSFSERYSPTSTRARSMSSTSSESSGKVILLKRLDDYDIFFYASKLLKIAETH